MAGMSTAAIAMAHPGGAGHRGIPATSARRRGRCPPTPWAQHACGRSCGRAGTAGRGCSGGEGSKRGVGEWISLLSPCCGTILQRSDSEFC